MAGLRSPGGSSGSFVQAVSRSNEFLSCAKTSWKIGQQEKIRQQQRDAGEGNPAPPPPPPRNPNLRLASSSGSPPASLAILEDGLTLLRGMEYGTKKLQGLVRRRGHTNDPTEEIGSITKQLEQDFKELTSYCEQILKIRRRKQEKRHWELVVQWFLQVKNRHSEQLQESLKLRGEILADQAQKRRKLVERNGGNKNKTDASFKGAQIGTSLGAASASGAATPLFTATATTNRNNNKKSERGNNFAQQKSASRRVQPAASSSSSNYYRQKTPATNGTGTGTGTAGTAYGTGYGAAYGGMASSNGYAGYGGGGYGGSGMRQRRGNNPPSSTIPVEEQEEEEKIHSQIQMRERKRQTQQRLDEARQAESTLSEVAKLYGKMSTLITQQGETLEKIEDDVEVALVDVSAGQEELTKLYSIKKGNRPLIIKTFLILNFLIIFMRGYRDR